MKKSTLSLRLVLFGARFAVAAFAVFALAAVAAAQMPGGGWNVPGSTIIIRDAREEVVVHWYHSNPDADTFYISKAKELAEFAGLVNGGNGFWEKTVVLTDDIDLSAYGREYNDGKGWIPIGSAYYDDDIGYVGVEFGGVFDGNGKVVRNLYINDPNSHYIGLFGVSTGIVKNLGVVDVDVLGLQDVGGLAGLGKEVINCYSTGTVKGVNSVGGLVGSNYGYGSFTANSYSTATVIGVVRPGSDEIGYNIGGLAGAAWAGAVITNCYATGTVTGVGNNIGGLVGGIGAAHTEEPSFVLNSAALNPSVTMGSEWTTAVGRVVGNMHAGEAVGNGVSNNAAYSDMSLKRSGGNIIITLLPDSTGANHRNGQSYIKVAINSDPSLGNRFTPENGWTIQRGYLPGLFGNLVEMPSYLRPSAKQLAAPAAPAPTGEFTAGPNPASRQQAGTIRFYYTGTKPLTGNLTIYNASGSVVKRIVISDNNNNNSSDNSANEFSAKRQVGFWDLTDAKGRHVPEGTYLAKGVVVADGIRERVSLIMGVRQ